MRAAQSRYGPSSLSSICTAARRRQTLCRDWKSLRTSRLFVPSEESTRGFELLIPYMLTNFCGGVHSVHIAKAVMRHVEVDELTSSCIHTVGRMARPAACADSRRNHLRPVLSRGLAHG